jgi:hypothetical protein
MQSQRFLFVLLSIFCLINIGLFSEESLKTSEKLKEIDTQIEVLQKDLHETNLKFMESEVNSQNYMKYEWKKYIEEIQKAEKSEQKIHEIEIQLEKLKTERTLLLNNKA